MIVTATPDPPPYLPTHLPARSRLPLAIPLSPRIVLPRRTYHPCLRSVHGNVRLWTLNGVMIGTFGQGRTLTTARSPWHLNDESTYSCLEPVSPLTEAELYEQEQHRPHYSSDYYSTYSSDY